MSRRSARRAGILGATALAAAAAAAALAIPASPAFAARWAWSGAVVADTKHLVDVDDPEALTTPGTVVEWSLKAVVDVSDRVTVNARLCTTCHGLSVDQAYAELRWAPPLNLEAGRISVPFGDFVQRHDASSDAFLSKPLPYAMGHMLRYQVDRFNLGVIPMPYADNGASAFGDVWIRDALQVWYALYAVNGFSSGTPRDFTFKNQVADTGFLDNNRSLSWGARLALAQGPATLGGSLLRGAYDPTTAFEYEAWGVDASLWQRGFQLRAEYLERETDVLDEQARAVLRKKGFFVQLETPAWRRFSAGGRFDGLLREGPPLATDNDSSSGITRWTAGLAFAPTLDTSLRAQAEYWRFTDFEGVGVLHAGVVTTY
jgi:hypothetical protein